MSKNDGVIVGVPGIGAGVLIDPSKPAPVRIASAEEQEARKDELRRVFNELRGYAGGEVRDAVQLLTEDVELGGQVRYRVRVPWGLTPGSLIKVAERFHDVAKRYEAALVAYKQASPIELPKKGQKVEREDAHDDEGDE
jgi:hypothetical protein